MEKNHGLGARIAKLSPHKGVVIPVKGVGGHK